MAASRRWIITAAIASLATAMAGWVPVQAQVPVAPPSVTGSWISFDGRYVVPEIPSTTTRTGGSFLGTASGSVTGRDDLTPFHFTFEAGRISLTDFFHSWFEQERIGVLLLGTEIDHCGAFGSSILRFHQGWIESRPGTTLTGTYGTTPIVGFRGQVSQWNFNAQFAASVLIPFNFDRITFTLADGRQVTTGSMGAFWDNWRGRGTLEPAGEFEPVIGERCEGTATDVAFDVRGVVAATNTVMVGVTDPQPV